MYFKNEEQECKAALMNRQVKVGEYNCCTLYFYENKIMRLVEIVLRRGRRNGRE
jgi:hypothetical protein